MKIVNELPKKPIAKIIFEGLFVLCVNEETQQADVWIYEYANNHDFFIQVSLKKYSDDTEAGRGGQLIKRLEGKRELSSGDIKIAVIKYNADANSKNNQLAPISCFQHAKISDELFVSTPLEKPEEEKMITPYSQDFRWIIDLEGRRFHKEKLEIIPGVLLRKITVPSGILYTQRLIGRNVVRAYPATKSEKKTSHSPCYITNQLGISIEQLNRGEIFSLFYESDEEAPHTLPLATPPPPLAEDKSKAPSSTYYEIYISNNCPPPKEGEEDKELTQSDFQHYYNAFNIPAQDRLELKILEGSGHRLTPCDLIYLSQTPEITVPEEE
jgi:hypothetical protein